MLMLDNTFTRNINKLNDYTIRRASQYVQPEIKK